MITIAIILSVFLVLAVLPPMYESASIRYEIAGAPPIIDNFSETGPLLSGDHNNEWLTITCDVDDTTQEGSDILSAEISIDGGSWLPMNPVIPPFDNTFETVTINWTAPPGYYAVGVHDYVVRATDADGGSNPGVADDFTIVDTTDPTGLWTSIPGATVNTPGFFTFRASYEDFMALDFAIANSYFEYQVNGGGWNQFAWVNESFAWGSFTNVVNYTLDTGIYAGGDVIDYRGYLDDTGGGSPVPLGQGQFTILQGVGPPEPYYVDGRVYLYDGTSTSGYSPLLAGAGASVVVTWWNHSSSDWSTIITVTNAAGQYNVEFLVYFVGGTDLIFINATFNAPYSNNGYNYSYIGYAGSTYQDVLCGVPYDVKINKPPDPSNLQRGVPFDIEYEIIDIGGVRAPGYFTFADGPMNLSASGTYLAPPDRYFNGTASLDPGHHIGTMTMFTSGNDQWINVSEGGLPENNSYLTPFGAFDIDPWSTPGYLKDWDEITVNFESVFFISLDEGWNLVSLPLEQTDESITEVLSSIYGKWDCVRHYDAVNSSWMSYNIHRPISLNDLYYLDHRMGFWINVTEPNVTLTVSGPVPVSTGINLYAGWNLVGYPSFNMDTVANALWGTGADEVMVCDLAEPYHIKNVGPAYLMKPGEGYWIHVPADSVWVVEGGERVVRGFDWLLVQGFNLISCPQDPVMKGSNGIFDAYDALNICHAWTNDDNISIQLMGNQTNLVLQDFHYGDDESTAFPMDGVHGYRINLTVPGYYVIRVEAVNYTDPNACTVLMDTGWTLLGFTHNYTPWTGVPRAKDFTDGTIDPDLDIAGPLTKIVVTEWLRDAQWIHSYIVADTFPGMEIHNWHWDFSYSDQPGNAFWLWVSEPVNISFDTEYDSN